MHHFDHIVASLCFERDGVSLPIFPGCSPVTRSRDVFCLYTSDQPQHQPGDDRNDRRRRARSPRRAPRSLRSLPAPACRQLRAILTKPSQRSVCWSRSRPDASRGGWTCDRLLRRPAAGSARTGPGAGDRHCGSGDAYGDDGRHRFSIVTTLPRTLIIARHLLHQYGFHQHCAALHAIDLPVLALEDGSGLAQEKCASAAFAR